MSKAKRRFQYVFRLPCGLCCAVAARVAASLLGFVHCVVAKIKTGRV
ncbi:hypothetical protein GCWU000324_02943 [Kingella oralis ATCC 51147]|uniref:Uncharacterized protein n=1 Tax=Kingella oralis ATCC 51147 TaxID=629741 RepID=C4GMK9_9NEIS|nr:hypothetical protein GCWU000324_02943 [Kingella oralis ATCC 51147]